MGEQLDRLKQRLHDIHNINRATSVLVWDMQTYMPPGGAEARGDQMATLSQLSHEMFAADETGALLTAAESEVAGLPDDGDDARLVQVTRRDYEEIRKVPPSFSSELAQHGARANVAWVKAREEDDFAAFAPYLEKAIEFSRRLAEYLGYPNEPYDALISQTEPGMTTAEVRAIFDDLKRDLVPFVQAVSERVDRVDDSVLHQPFDEADQETFGKMVVDRFGYDFSRGRLDRTVHPFEISFSRNDVRITTRYETDFLNPALFGTMHESGHALYEQGIAESLDGTLLASGTSAGVHESQSRLWENVVGRSRRFWQHYYPQLQQTFPQQLERVDLDTFYRAVNKVQPSFIRVEADEVTYNLHIMLRFEIEQELLSGTLAVEDVPAAWNRKMEEYLGVRPPNDALGALQDIHWSFGVLGGFTGYCLGNIMSLQFYDKAVQDQPGIPGEISRGEFASLHGWLTENIYRHGRKFKPMELVERATGKPLGTQPYMAYLKQKYGEIYGV